MDDTMKTSKGRGKLLAMAGAYGMGVFNDSFYRNSAMLLALVVFDEVEGPKLQSWIMALFTMPYLLLPWLAGWLADRFSKRRVVIGSKFMEVLAMGCGAAGIWTETWWLVLLMAFMMGLQSCVFAPALNGAVPELFPEDRVVVVNSRLKMVMAIMVVLGIAISGEVLGFNTNKDGSAASLWGVPCGQLYVGIGVIVLALLGWAVSFGVPYRPPASPHAKFPYDGPVHTIRTLCEIFRDREFRTVLLVDVWIWTFGAMLLQAINMLAKQFGAKMEMASRLNALEMLGLAAGGLLSVRLSRQRRWIHFLGGAMILVGITAVGMKGLECMPAQHRWALGYALQILTGVFIGLVLIPCESFLQIRPPADRKGDMLAASNFLIFAGITGGSLLMGVMLERFGAVNSIATLGVLSWPIGIWLLLYRHEKTPGECND